MDRLRIPPSRTHAARWWYMRASAFWVLGFLVGTPAYFLSVTPAVALARYVPSLILMGVGAFLFFKGARASDRTNKRGAFSDR